MNEIDPLPGGEKRGSVRRSSLSEADRVASRRLSNLRKSAGMTLRRLGKLSGLSEAYLSRVENERAALTVANISRLGEVFSVNMACFLEPDDPQLRLTITRDREGPQRRFRGRQGTVVELLADKKVNKLMEPLIVDVLASGTECAPRGHSGEEFNLVLEGECLFEYGSESYKLVTGDSVYFDAGTPHLLRSVGVIPVRVLAVVTSRDQRFHNDIGRVVMDRIQA